jgi:sulfite reductase beta subunit-like hemoprotein
MLSAGNRMVVTVRPETRSLEQNARMWAMLTEISEQVEWHGKKLTPQDWKHVFSASLKRLDVVPNLDGTGFVALGMSTSKMTKAEMSDMQTLMEAFGAEHGVKFSAQEPA